MLAVFKGSLFTSLVVLIAVQISYTSSQRFNNQRRGIQNHGSNSNFQNYGERGGHRPELEHHYPENSNGGHGGQDYDVGYRDREYAEEDNSVEDTGRYRDRPGPGHGEYGGQNQGGGHHPRLQVEHVDNSYDGPDERRFGGHDNRDHGAYGGGSHSGGHSGNPDHGGGGPSNHNGHGGRLDHDDGFRPNSIDPHRPGGHAASAQGGHGASYGGQSEGVQHGNGGHGGHSGSNSHGPGPVHQGPQNPAQHSGNGVYGGGGGTWIAISHSGNKGDKGFRPMIHKMVAHGGGGGGHRIVTHPNLIPNPGYGPVRKGKGGGGKKSLTAINAAAILAIQQIKALDRAASYSFSGGGGSSSSYGRK